MPRKLKTHCVRGHEYNEENTRWHGKDHKQRRCAKCISLHNKIHREKHKSRILKRLKEKYAMVRAEMIAAYGGKCQCDCGCEVTEPCFLTIDHIFNDGRIHRQQHKSHEMYFDLKRRGWPKDRYRLLCYNCNCARERQPDKVCPALKRKTMAVLAKNQ